MHFTKRQGAPVRFVSGDDLEEAGAVRELDLRKKFHMRATELAQRLNLTPPKAAALRDHLNIGDDKQCTHTFEFGKTKIPCYSDNAARRMKEALDEVDMGRVWEAYVAKTRFGRRRPIAGNHVS